MKICFVYKNLDLGGVQSKIATLSNNFADNGHIVKICLFNRRKIHFAMSPSVEICNLDGTNKLRKLFRFFKFLYKLDADLVVVPTAHFAVVTMAFLFFMRSRLPIIVMEESDTTLEYASARGINKLPFILTRCFYRKADGIIAVSRGVRRSLCNFAMLSTSRVKVIYNPIYSHNIDVLAAEPLEHKWLSDKAILVFIAAGRFVPQKNFRLLIDSFHALAKGRDDVRLIILGDGPLMQAHLEQVKDLGIQAIVDFPGQVKNPYQWFAQSQFFVLSSAWEGFGNVIVEALSCGCTAISTNCPSGPDEILDYGLYGFIAESGNVQSLKNAMNAAIEKPTDPDAAKRRAKHFSIEKSSAEYLKYFRQVSERNMSEESAE